MLIGNGNGNAFGHTETGYKQVGDCLSLENLSAKNVCEKLGGLFTINNYGYITLKWALNYSELNYNGN